MCAARSLVHWYSKSENQKCGYCNSPTGSVMFGMWAYRLKIDDYQALIDRGWRRSGQYCYKPVMHETCCPLYTIRCHALEFRPTKSQKKVMKKMSKFLKTGIFKEREKKELNNTTEEGSEEKVEVSECPTESIDIDEIVQKGDFEQSNVVYQKFEKEENVETACGTSNERKSDEKSENSAILKQRAVKIGLGADPNRPPCKKAKLLRHEKRIKKIEGNQNENSRESSEIPTPISESKSLEDYLNNISEDNKHKLTLKLIEPSNPNSEWKKYENIEFELYKKYQSMIHRDSPNKITMSGFRRFLVNTPLHRKVHPDHAEDPNVPAYGSYHQQYWLDDKLIAVGVIDILSKCVSAVYFFYDPDYRELTLGTYGALKEVQLCRELYPTLGTSYYYMGYYVHSCRKMRYKGNMHPSDLLCPETYKWFPVEKCVDRLDKNKYSRFNDDLTVIDLDECTERELDNLKVVSGEQYTTYGAIKNELNMEQEFRIIGRLIGRKAARSLIVVESL